MAKLTNNTVVALHEGQMPWMGSEAGVNWDVRKKRRKGLPEGLGFSNVASIEYGLSKDHNITSCVCYHLTLNSNQARSGIAYRMHRWRRYKTFRSHEWTCRMILKIFALWTCGMRVHIICQRWVLPLSICAGRLRLAIRRLRLLELFPISLMRPLKACSNRKGGGLS